MPSRASCLLCTHALFSLFPSQLEGDSVIGIELAILLCLGQKPTDTLIVGGQRILLFDRLREALILLAVGIPFGGPMPPNTKLTSRPGPPADSVKDLEDAIRQERPVIQDNYHWWFKTWARLIRDHRVFDARFCPRLEPGDIVNVDFGCNVGHEMSGRHWAVVIGVRDKKKSPILHVIPLSSEKIVDGEAQGDAWLRATSWVCHSSDGGRITRSLSHRTHSLNRGS